MKSFLLLSILLAGLNSLIIAQTNSIDYFGQTTSGDKVVIYATDIISQTNCAEHKITFLPDGNECNLFSNVS